jgi:hypothetical protein
MNELIEWGVDPTIYVQGRGTKAPFGRRGRARMGETHPYGERLPLPNYILMIILIT